MLLISKIKGYQISVGEVKSILASFLAASTSLVDVKSVEIWFSSVEHYVR